MVVRRLSALFLVLGCVLASSLTAYAATNPFKKTKDYQFNDSIAWYFTKDGAAIKSGSEQEAGDILYYHLKINKNLLRLRFGKNDPSGELESTRSFDELEIVDVIADGQRLKRFQWCLDNQGQIATTLKQNAVVMNGACVSAGGGDFSIVLDDETRERLLKARNLEIVAVPYGRPIRLNYTMTGFAKGYAAIIAPPPPPPPVAVETPKAEPKPAVIKTCMAEAPEEFQGVVKAIAYICDDKAKKASAETTIQSLVSAERKKRKDADAERQRLEAERLKDESERKSVESDWEKKQAEMWVDRCQKHWSKGVSPCYCTPYIDHAPAGVVNTCNK